VEIYVILSLFDIPSHPVGNAPPTITFLLFVYFLILFLLVVICFLRRDTVFLPPIDGDFNLIETTLLLSVSCKLLLNTENLNISFGAPEVNSLNVSIFDSKLSVKFILLPFIP